MSASKGQSVFNQLTITNVGNVKLKATISTEGENKQWLLFSTLDPEVDPDHDQVIDFEIDPTISEGGTYPVNITVSSVSRTETLGMLINVIPGCACGASQPTGVCVNKLQEVTSYACNEGTNYTCEPVKQKVSCDLVKKRKLLLPFWESPIEHVEANLWLILLVIVAYAAYRYYKKRQAAMKNIS